MTDVTKFKVLDKQTFDRLPPKIKKKFKNITRLSPYPENTHEYYGCTVRIIQRVYQTTYSSIKCQCISDLAFQGVAAHEIAEAYYEHYLKFYYKFYHLLLSSLGRKDLIKDHELIIDELACSWGFEKEIQQKNEKT